MFESRKTTILFPSRLNDYYCEEKKGSYGPQFSEAYSYEASHIDKSIPRKEKDPGSFTLPCYINNVCFDNALADLGASVSVMPLSTYLNLGLGELAHTKLIVELADRTVKYPKGIAKNVLVGIGKFVFPVDFIILDMPEDVKVPLILGRPFLSTAHAKIDVFKRKITLRVRDYTTRTMAEPILKKYTKSAQAESNPTEPNTDGDINIKLRKEFFMELKNNAYHRMFDEDVWTTLLRQWWKNKGEGKITTWEQLVEKFFCKLYPESHDGKDEMLDEGDNWGIDPLEFISQVNSLFKNHMKVDGRTKKVLFHSWMNGSWNKRRMDDNILNNNEWKKSDYGNPLNTATDSFFKAYDEHDIEEGNELRQMKRKEENKNDEQPNKRVCNAEKFEAIKYSLGPNEEYIAIRRCEYNGWERNKDSMSQIYQEIFRMIDEGWMVTRTE
ncbi:hypothetical protein Tco_0981012 [Tanacetum coccineum]